MALRTFHVLVQVVLQTHTTVTAVTVTVRQISLVSPILLLTPVVVAVVIRIDLLVMAVSLLSVVPVVAVLGTTDLGMSTVETQMVVVVATMMTSLPPVTSSLLLSPGMIGAGTALTSIVQTYFERLPSIPVLEIALLLGRPMLPI
jgi:hypothetical protein